MPCIELISFVLLSLICSHLFFPNLITLCRYVKSPLALFVFLRSVVFGTLTPCQLQFFLKSSEWILHLCQHLAPDAATLWQLDDIFAFWQLCCSVQVKHYIWVPTVSHTLFCGQLSVVDWQILANDVQVGNKNENNKKHTLLSFGKGLVSNKCSLLWYCIGQT